MLVSCWNKLKEGNDLGPVYKERELPQQVGYPSELP